MSEQDRKRDKQRAMNAAFDHFMAAIIDDARDDLRSGDLPQWYRGRLTLALMTAFDTELRLVAATGDSKHSTAFLAALPEVLAMIISKTAASCGEQAASVERMVLDCTRDSLAAYGVQGDDGDAPGNGVH